MSPDKPINFADARLIALLKRADEARKISPGAGEFAARRCALIGDLADAVRKLMMERDGVPPPDEAA